jgi:16S rRNA (guanine(966)-N(2))-methyltransferase RsmD
VREALFSIWGDRLEGARVLDLFAGSGVVCLEALSRGALSVLCADADLRAIKVLEENAARLGGGIEVRRLTLPAGLTRLTGPFDLIFADPPYAFEGYEDLLAGIVPLLAPDGEIVIEHSSRRDLPVEAGPLVRADIRKYGESALSFYRRIRAAASDLVDCARWENR